MAFIEDIIFPTGISRGSRGGPGFRHSVFESDTGQIQTISRWSRERRTYDAKYGIRSFADIRVVHDLYLAVGGLSNGFRFQDVFDNTTASDGVASPTNADATIGTGDGTQTIFQLVKTYTSATTTHTRTLEKPVSGTVLVALDGSAQTEGVDFTVDSSSGQVSFTSAPGIGVQVTAGCSFHVPVQFGVDIDDVLDISLAAFNVGEIPSIPLFEMVGGSSTPRQPYRGGGSLQSISAHTLYDYAFGHSVVWSPTAAGLFVVLPAIADLPGGGPIFSFYNSSATDSLDFRNREAGGLEFSLAATTGALIGIRTTASVNNWIAFGATVST